MFQNILGFMYNGANAQIASGTPLLAEIDATGFLASAVGAIGDNFEAVAVIGASVLALIIGLWAVRALVRLASVFFKN